MQKYYRQKKSEVRCGIALQRSSLLLMLCLGGGITQAHDNLGSVQDDGRFTPNRLGEVFPPQHREIENVQWFKPEPQTRVKHRSSDLSEEQVEAIATQIQQDPGVSSLLGENYGHLSTEVLLDKTSNSNNRYLITFFSYSVNRTVSVVWDRETIQQVRVSSAEDDQPALSQAEMDRAITLATSYWDQRGVGRVHELVGYAIQTFDTDGSPFPSRMAYVSFHTSTPEIPELVTWVDLSTDSVTRGEIAE